jgi:hypothetical protein
MGNHLLDRCSVAVRQIAIVSRADSLLLLVRLHFRFLEQSCEAGKRTSGNECPWVSQKKITEYDYRSWRPSHRGGKRSESTDSQSPALVAECHLRAGTQLHRTRRIVNPSRSAPLLMFKMRLVRLLQRTKEPGMD